MAFDRIEHSGNAIPATLDASIAAGDTSLTLTDATGWPTGGTGPFYLEIDPNTATYEKILATSRSGNVLSGLTRGADGTTDVAHDPSTDAVLHIFSAAEADEANSAANQTVGAVTDRGDLLVGASAQLLQVQTVGADNLVLTADSTSSTGMKWALVDNVSIAPDTITEAKFSTGYRQKTTFSVASVSSGRVIIPHGASFTPTFVQIMFSAPNTLGAAVGFVAGWVVDSIDSTDVTVRVTVTAGGIGSSGAFTGLVNSGVTCAGTIITEA